MVLVRGMVTIVEVVEVCVWGGVVVWGVELEVELKVVVAVLVGIESEVDML